MSTETDLNDSHDPQFEPLVSLPEKVVPTMEENEEVVFKIRAKLFRWCKESESPEWKERGTGDIKLLKHRSNSRVRVLMRRDKTFKICANHYLEKHMKLLPNHNSDRAWVWSTFADFSEEEPREELLAIRFLNAENANKFKDKFEECQKTIPDEISSFESDADEVKTKSNCDKTNEVVDKLGGLAVKDDDVPSVIDDAKTNDKKDKVKTDSEKDEENGEKTEEKAEE